MAGEDITISLDKDDCSRLDELARQLEIGREAVLVNAVQAYLDVQSWQIEHIRAGLAQAEAGEFASDDEIAEAFDRWNS